MTREQAIAEMVKGFKVTHPELGRTHLHYSYQKGKDFEKCFFYVPFGGAEEVLKGALSRDDGYIYYVPPKKTVIKTATRFMTKKSWRNLVDNKGGVANMIRSQNSAYPCRVHISYEVEE